MNNETLTWEAIHTWAAAFPNDQAIGMTNTCVLCPVATYLRQTTGDYKWTVTPLFNGDCAMPMPYALHNATGETRTLPDWLQDVVEAVDASAKKPTPISKAVFLSILADHKPLEAQS